MRQTIERMLRSNSPNSAGSCPVRVLPSIVLLTVAHEIGKRAREIFSVASSFSLSHQYIQGDVGAGSVPRREAACLRPSWCMVGKQEMSFFQNKTEEKRRPRF